ncbi:MAG: enoyl-CoA hydratase/isomerase family protein [Paraburkholderia sp.]|uniref:enoyl-CoA hydratase/isomerase family protein n=1 Tax=Paraburkholderia sp. TaxID=1926495 RepID=UPI003C61BE16
METDIQHKQIRIERRSRSYWKVLLDNPPFNIFGPATIPDLSDVIVELETDPEVKVAVFESTVPGFFLNHYDFTRPLEESTRLAPGPTGMHPLPDLLARLSRAPVVSISSIRGRTTGVGSELALATDMRFASRENAFLSQFEVGAGFVPGGGPMARLSRLIGRGRTLEVVLSAADINGELAELYGYVNRSFPDSELDGFVDALASRIATFDKSVISNVKRLVNHATLPSDPDINAEWTAFIGSVQQPEAQRRITKLMEMGLQTSPDVEQRLNQITGTL